MLKAGSSVLVRSFSQNLTNFARVFAITSPGLSSSIENEIKVNNFHEFPTYSLSRTGVGIHTNDEGLWKFCMTSRTADNVRVTVGSCSILSRSRFDVTLKNIEWEKYFQKGTYLAVLCGVSPGCDVPIESLKESISSCKRLGQCVDGIVFGDQLVGVDPKSQVMFVYCSGTEITVSLLAGVSTLAPWADPVYLSTTSGLPSNSKSETSPPSYPPANPFTNKTHIQVMRNNSKYRMYYVTAFTPEQTAASLCYDVLRRSSLHKPLIIWDPFCGSGITITEMVSILHRDFPHFQRWRVLGSAPQYHFQKWPSYDPVKFRVVEEQLLELKHKSPILSQYKAIGQDRSFDAIRAASMNYDILTKPSDPNISLHADQDVSWNVSGFRESKEMVLGKAKAGEFDGCELMVVSAIPFDLAGKNVYPKIVIQSFISMLCQLREYGVNVIASTTVAGVSQVLVPNQHVKEFEFQKLMKSDHLFFNMKF